MTMNLTPRLLEDCPEVLLLLYTPGPAARPHLYEPWLVETDNPFFNAIPGIHHYANWKVETVLTGPDPGYTHFDFLGLRQTQDLEHVWFNQDLTTFRKEWVRLWGYGLAAPAPIQANAYAMRPTTPPTRNSTEWALVTGGSGTPPPADLAWTIETTIPKHYALGPTPGPWQIPKSRSNPLGLDWLAVRYGPDQASLAAAYTPGPETTALIAWRIAAP